jgi:hypothetical protein
METTVTTVGKRHQQIQNKLATVTNPPQKLEVCVREQHLHPIQTLIMMAVSHPHPESVV